MQQLSAIKQVIYESMGTTKDRPAIIYATAKNYNFDN